jgi:hypothetical protein
MSEGGAVGKLANGKETAGDGIKAMNIIRTFRDDFRSALGGYLPEHKC